MPLTFEVRVSGNDGAVNGARSLTEKRRKKLSVRLTVPRMESTHTKEIEVMDRDGNVLIIAKAAMTKCFRVARHKAREDDISEALAAKDLTSVFRNIEKREDIRPF